MTTPIVNTIYITRAQIVRGQKLHSRITTLNYRWTESVTALQNFLERPTWEQLVEKRRNGFLRRIYQADPYSLERRFL